REVVNSLNAYLEKNPEVKAKLKLDDDTRKLLLDRFDLTADQLAEIADGQFRSLDAAYLEECWLLRQAAFSQGMQGLNTLQRARRAFEWVVSQVALLERLGAMQMLQRRPAEVVPPQVVLQRGFGHALERYLVFLALLRQLNIDGCMIGFPAEDKGKSTYWVPGAIISEKDANGKDAVPPGIYLFEPRLGAPLPGPEGQEIATLK